jgi:hypothetical protein
VAGIFHIKRGPSPPALIVLLRPRLRWRGFYLISLMGVTLVPLYDHAFDKLTLGALVRADLVIWLARLDPTMAIGCAHAGQTGLRRRGWLTRPDYGSEG